MIFTWVTALFILIALAVVAGAYALSSGRLADSFDEPYAHVVDGVDDSAGVGESLPGVEWSEPAAGGDLPIEDPIEDEPGVPAQHQSQTTGESTHGRHEAQDR